MPSDTGFSAESSHAEPDDFEERVRNLAYELWQKEGEPEGHGDEYWLRAEQRVRAADATEQPEPAHEPLDPHDVAMTESFPASDPPSSTPAASTISSTRHDLPEGKHPVDEESQEEAALERETAGGYS